MTKEQEKSQEAQFLFRGIELLNSYLNIPENPKIVVDNINFNINIESGVDETRKLVFVIVKVEMMSNDQSFIFGAIIVSCLFEIANFQDIIKINADGSIIIPDTLIDVFQSISISTTRGVMFSTFKGTFLHNAILPIIDPKKFRPTKEINEEKVVSTKKKSKEKTS